MNWSEFQTKIAFKLSLEGEALVWSRALDSDIAFRDLEMMFLARFIPPNNTVVCITELAEATQNIGESLLGFLDRMRGIAAKGKLPMDVLLAMALKALPKSLSNKLVICPEGINWDTLYKLCGVWDATGLGMQEEANCFYGGYNGVTSRGLQSRSAVAGCQGETMNRRQIRPESSDYGKFNNRYSGNATGSRGKIVCFYCDIMGHSVKNCFKLQQDKRK